MLDALCSLSYELTIDVTSILLREVVNEIRREKQRGLFSEYRTDRLRFKRPKNPPVASNSPSHDMSNYHVKIEDDIITSEAVHWVAFLPCLDGLA